jgi:PAS domain S-box-containing protein
MSSKATRFESLLEAVPDALVGMDQEGVIRFVNRQSESLFGYDRDELIGQPVETLVPESLWQIYAEHRDQYFADPRTRSSGLDLQLSGRRRDGSEFPINISLSHIDTGDVLLVITAVQDVTQQRRAIQNAQLTAAIVEYSDDAIIATTLEGIITSWNPAAERMYGYSKKEIISRSVSLLIPKDRAGDKDALLANVRVGQAVDHFESLRVRKDQTVVPVSITIAPIRDEDGAVVGASGVHRDVSEQRQALEIAQQMAAIVHSSDDAIIGRNLDGLITSWNPAAAKMFGYSSQEIIGRSVDLLIPEDRPGEISSVVAKISTGLPAEHLETIRVRKDGSVFPVSLTVSPILDADGAVAGASVICRDQSVQRQLFEAAQLMAAIVESSEDAIFGRNLEGTITSWNPAAERLFGYSSEEIVGKPVEVLVPPDRAGEYSALLAKISAGHPVEHLETDRVRKDGTLVPVWITTSPIRDQSDAVVGASMICRDVTELKEATEASRRMAAIVEYSDDAIIGSTLEGIITSWNPAAQRMYGYSGEKVVRRSVEVLSPGDRTGEIRAVLAKISAGRTVENFETIHTRMDKSTFPVKLTVAPVHDTKGAVIGASAIARDVTEQRKALAAAQQMAAIIESSDDAIIGRDLAGIVTSWNPAAVRMFGYSSREIVGKPIDLLTPEDRTGEAQAVLARISAGQPVEHLETNRVRKGGTVVPVSLTISPIRDHAGTVVGASVIARDMSQPK